MITRKKYAEEFKKNLAIELISNQATVAQISKKEGIAPNTLYKWVQKFNGEGFSAKDEDTVKLKKRISDLESTVSELALENYVLKKNQKLLAEYRYKEKLSGAISPQKLE